MSPDVTFLNKECHVEFDIYKIEFCVISFWNLIFVKSSFTHNSIFKKLSSKMVVLYHIVYKQFYFVENFGHVWYLASPPLNFTEFLNFTLKFSKFWYGPLMIGVILIGSPSVHINASVFVKWYLSLSYALISQIK